jgi:isoleucyl-tRNA synthetase
LSLSLEISPGLKLEGLARNINRIIQDLRKQMELAYDRRITLFIQADGDYGRSLTAHQEWLMAQTLADDLQSEVVQPQFALEDEAGCLNIQMIPV